MKKQPKYFIEDVSFEFEEDEAGFTPHLAYTIAAQGGAASGWNDPLLLKAHASESPEVKEFLAVLTKMKQDKELSSEGSTPQDMLKGTQSAPLEDPNIHEKGNKMSEITQEKLEEIVKAAVAAKDAEVASLQAIVKSLEAKQEAAEKEALLNVVKGFVVDVEEAANLADSVHTLRKNGMEEQAATIMASLEKAHKLAKDSDLFKEVGVKQVSESDVAREEAMLKAMNEKLGL